jgi:hypothetical protein
VGSSDKVGVLCWLWKVEGAEFVILECVPSVKKMFFHAKQALHTSHITRTQFHYLITRNLCVYFLKIN